MVGEHYADKDVYVERDLGDTILELRGFSGQGFSDVNLSVRRGEVVALTGLAGSGASELMQTMFGALPATAGQISVQGKPVRGDIPRFMRRHVGMLPTNRKENSVVPDFSVLDNVVLAEHSLTGSHPVIRRKPELVRFGELKEMLNIRVQDPDDAITSLSGGNQQKVFLARWLDIDADVLLLDNPTQGVDVGAKGEIYAQILELAKAGKTIIINTLEIPEIKRVSDRCVVFYAGRVVAVLDHGAISEHDVMLYSTNAAQLSEQEE
jgi:ribose transport system ATP-binding protein